MNRYEQIINLIRESQNLDEGMARIKRLGKAINKAVKKGDTTKEAKLRSAAKSAEAKLNRRDDAGMEKAAKKDPYDIFANHPDKEVRRQTLWDKNRAKNWSSNPKTKNKEPYYPKLGSYESRRRYSRDYERY